MNFFEIKNDSIEYENLEMKKAKIISFEGKEYVEFFNKKEHKYIVMEKISDDICTDITDKELKEKIIESNFIKAEDYVE